jgi:hypothetical protein
MPDMRKRTKEKVSVSTEKPSEFDTKYEKSVEEMADAVIDSLKVDYQSDLEPFERYAERVKAKIHSNVDNFRGRLSKGYKAILEEIEKNQKEFPPTHSSIKP